MSTPAAQFPWPDLSLFLALEELNQYSDGSIRCIRIACLTDEHLLAARIRQGEKLHFFAECAVFRDLEVAACGVALTPESGAIVYGKNTFQQPRSPHRILSGSVLRFHHWVDMHLKPGIYSVTFSLASTDIETYHAYRSRSIGHMNFQTQERCRVSNLALVQVDYGETGYLSHHGYVGLPDHSFLTLESCSLAPSPASQPKTSSDWPTLLHITHWQAGFQWIFRILRHCAPERIVELDQGQIRFYPIRVGHLYPTVYLSRDEVNRIAPPPNTRKFVVIRDLRDTLVSAYFSFRTTHPVLADETALRSRLESLTMEEGMLYLMAGFLQDCAEIQLS